MQPINKKDLSERDICSKYITPALVNKAGWNLHTQIREEVSFTKGRVYVQGKIVSRGQVKRADYILYYKPNIPIAVIQELLDKGIVFDALIKEVGDYDPFDLICHVGFGQAVMDRRLRAERVREAHYLSKYSDKAKAVLNALLDKYVNEGVESIEDINVLKVKPISDFGTPLEVVKLFGSKVKYEAALRELKAQIYMIPVG